MQRRVRQHQPDERTIGRHLGGETSAGSAAGNHDRPLHRCQQRALRIGQDRQLLGGLQVAHHDGERLLVPTFSQAECPHGGRIGRITGEVEPAQPFDADNETVSQRRRCGLNGIDRVQHGALSCHQHQARPAARARVGLGVEPSIPRVFVLALTVADTS